MKDQYSLVAMFNQFENLQKYSSLECWKVIFSGDFVYILCECNLPTYYPRFTVNNDQVRENINIVLVTMFN